MEKIQVDKKDIAAVIGKGGATIREIVELSGAKLDINDDGMVTIAAADEESRNEGSANGERYCCQTRNGKNL